MDTLLMVLGILGFLVTIVLVFFGGFVVLDYVWERLGGDE